MSSAVNNLINDYYSSESVAIKTNLSRILLHGKLGNTGKMLILPVDQGFEHGPDKSFLKNTAAYDPCYHHGLAVESGFSAYAAPLGMLERSAAKYLSNIPLILKLNSASLLLPKNEYPDQAFTSGVKDAVRLGCSAVGITIYPGSEKFKDMIEEAKDVVREARSCGLPTVIWAYARGGDIPKEMENALDVISYGAHMSCLLGAHIVKVKLPSEKIMDKSIEYGDISSLESRIKIIKRSCFDGKRLVVFSGGATKDDTDLLQEISAIKNAEANGSIIGRNVFQRSYEDAKILINKIISVYKV